MNKTTLLFTVFEFRATTRSCTDEYNRPSSAVFEWLRVRHWICLDVSKHQILLQAIWFTWKVHVARSHLLMTCFDVIPLFFQEIRWYCPHNNVTLQVHIWFHRNKKFRGDLEENFNRSPSVASLLLEFYGGPTRCTKPCGKIMFLSSVSFFSSINLSGVAGDMVRFRIQASSFSADTSIRKWSSKQAAFTGFQK